MSACFIFDNSYALLPDRLYTRLNPTPVTAPRLVKLNAALAVSLGLDPEALASPECVEVLAGNRVPEGASPIALAYAGHQFGQFVPLLGDGRAILLGEVVGRDGERHDIQLKGSGLTPFSRSGDGRAALGPVLREYIVSEAMAALGVPTTRALAVVTRQAELMAKWLLVGFIHGVMNTDNTSIAGETIDYGPCAFMDAYDPAKVFSSIDYAGRYAYGNQPRIAQWNLARFAETLLPLLGEDEKQAVAVAQGALTDFVACFQASYRGGLQRKIGLTTEREGDAALAQGLLTCMADNSADFTLTFRRLCDAAAGEEGDPAVRTLFADASAYDTWAAPWHRRLAEDNVDPDERRAAMRAVNPAFIPRNHLVEAAIAAAVTRDDFVPFEELVEVLARPYEDRPGSERYAAPPTPEERVQQTFCGT